MRLLSCLPPAPRDYNGNCKCVKINGGELFWFISCPPSLTHLGGTLRPEKEGGAEEGHGGGGQEGRSRSHLVNGGSHRALQQHL